MADGGRVDYPYEKWDDHLKDTYRFIPTDDMEELILLDQFRGLWEIYHGPTADKPYSSQLPRHQRDLMRRDHPEDYYWGLPEFARKYYEELAERNSWTGELDRCDDDLIAAFVKRRGRFL